jgi:hypothetical protein
VFAGTHTFSGRQRISCWLSARSLSGSQCRENVWSDNVDSVGHSKNSWEMSNRVDAKRHRCEGAKLCGPEDKQNEIERGNQNENDTSTNEKSSHADS